MVDGKPQHRKDGVYYVRFGTDGCKQQYVLASKDPFVALDKLEGKENDGCTTGKRQVVPQTPACSKPQTSKLSTAPVKET